MHRQHLIVLGIALAVLGALAAGGLFQRAGVPDVADVSIDADIPPAEPLVGEPPPAETRLAPHAADPAPRLPASPLSAEAGVRRLLLRGTDGNALPTAQARLFGAGRVIHLEVGPDGAAVLPAGAEGLGHMSAAVALPGGPTVAVPATALGAAEVVVTVPPGWEFTGRVLADATNTGIAHLPIVVSSAPVRAYAVFPEDVDDAAWSSAHPDAAEPPARVDARTDAEGRFRVRVASRTMSIVADPRDEIGRRWFVVQPGEPLPSTQEATLRAMQAATIEANLTDAGTGTPLRSSDVGVALGRTERGPELSFGMHVADGTFRATCPRLGGAGSALLPGSVSARAAGFLPLEVPFAFAESELTVHVDLRMQPLAAAGGDVTAVLEIRDEDGDPSDLPWFLEVASASQDRTRLSLAGLVRTAPGRYTAVVPPGEWALRILLPQPFADLYAASEVVRVEAEHPPTLRLRVPRGGPLVLTSSALSEGPSRRDLRLETPREGTTWWRGESIPPERREVRFYALPDGSREMRFSLGTGRTGAAVAVRVSKGTEPKVDVPAP